MTKQEEIREGIADCLPGAGNTTTNLWDTVDEIISCIHSQGVVIKVERELPDIAGFTIGISNPLEAYRAGQKDYQYSVSNAGYVAVKPLIKE